MEKPVKPRKTGLNRKWSLLGGNVQFVDFKDVFLFFGKELMPTKFGDENWVLKVSPTPGGGINFAPFTSYQIFCILIRKPKKSHFL